MKKTVFIMMAALFLLGITGCRKKAGCTDMSALNYDVEAQKDDNSCRYSNITFYAQYGYYSGIPITRIKVNIDGNAIGDINTVYPSAPGNCSATGTVSYACPSGETVSWNTVVYLANGATVFGSGSTNPTSFQDCIKVNVTQ